MTIKNVQFSSSTRRLSAVKPIHCKFSFEPYKEETPICSNQQEVSTGSTKKERLNRGNRNKQLSPKFQSRQLGGMYANYLKMVKPSLDEKLPHQAEDDFDDKALLKYCLDVYIENITSGNIVLGCIVQTIHGLEYIRILSSLMKSYAHVHIDLWTYSKESSLLKDVDLPNVRVYQTSDIPKTMLESTNILTFDMPETNGLLGEVLPDYIFFLSSQKGSHVTIPMGYTAIVQKTSALSEVTVVQKQKAEATDEQMIEVKSGTFDWVDKVKHLMSSVKNSKTSKLWLVHSGQEPDGIIGLVNCLRHEPGGEKIRLVRYCILQCGIL